tara:strand:+ start:92 stop:979 length:888 start_codon:yes stop_codon:yes gene_type:complete
MASPYQIAGVSANLADLMQKSNLQQQQSQRATSKQMGKMQEKFEDELEALQAKARKKASKGAGFAKLLNLIGKGFGPVGSALIGAITSGYQMQQQKKGAKMLLDKDMQKRYGNTFLRGGMKDFTRMAEDAQVSSGDVLRGAFGSGITSMALSSMLGGEEGLYKKVGEAKKAAKLVPQVEKGFEEYLGPDITDAYQDYLSSSIGESPISLEEYVKGGDFGDGLLSKSGYGEMYFGDKGFKPSMFNVDKNILSSKNPGASQIGQLLKQFTKGGIQGTSDNIQSAIMLPLLIQQLIGE